MKIAIVSSIDESCGNATFAGHLIQNLIDAGHECEGIGLNLALTQSLDQELRKAANNHVKKIADKLKFYDGVNIQFEAGLYGSSHSDIYNRLKLLVTANQNTSITIHATRFFDNSEFTFKRCLKELFALRLKTCLMSFARLQNNTRVLKNNRSYIKLCVEKRIKIIVHTIRSKDAILNLFQNADVHVHPIKFTNLNALPSSTIAWKNRVGVNSDDKLIGLFGFISKYKGHHDALKALKILPSNYKLVIAGRQHPGSIMEHEEVNGYLNSLITFIEEQSNEKKVVPLRERVRFLNELTDSELYDLAASVDFSWLPYLETGQDGSGIASILFDLSPRVIASNCKAFDELIRQVPQYKCERFDIGNYLELANKTINYRELRDFKTPLKFTDESQSKLYLDLLRN
jgi:glycosyltransferase involved in cell wall biosynthesis